MTPENQRENVPLAYFITITTYGTHLHGDPTGAVNPDHNTYNTPFIPGNVKLKKVKRSRMEQEPYFLDHPRRSVVLKTIRDVCDHRDWLLIACHVRKTHLHAVIHALSEPERMLNDLKSYASRRLNENGFDEPGRNRWTRHGSNPYLYRLDSLQSAVRYTIHEQGDRMAWKIHEDLEVEQFAEYSPDVNRILRKFLIQRGVMNRRGDIGTD